MAIKVEKTYVNKVIVQFDFFKP